MKIAKNLFVLPMLLSILFSFNVFAMVNEYKDPVRPSPQNERADGDQMRWTWIDDELCIHYPAVDASTKERLKRMYDLGAVSLWATNKDGVWSIKTRDTYSGKWSLSSEGIWSFEFDDKTIPVGVNKIDGVLYAFTGYGELKADYEYYDGLKTEADGLVKADSAEFTQWLTTQYLPECTSHE